MQTLLQVKKLYRLNVSITFHGHFSVLAMIKFVLTPLQKMLISHKSVQLSS